MGIATKDGSAVTHRSAILEWICRRVAGGTFWSAWHLILSIVYVKRWEYPCIPRPQWISLDRRASLGRGSCGICGTHASCMGDILWGICTLGSPVFAVGALCARPGFASRIHYGQIMPASQRTTFVLFDPIALQGTGPTTHATRPASAIAITAEMPY